MSIATFWNIRWANLCVGRQRILDAGLLAFITCLQVSPFQTFSSSTVCGLLLLDSAGYSYFIQFTMRWESRIDPFDIILVDLGQSYVYCNYPYANWRRRASRSFFTQSHPGIWNTPLRLYGPISLYGLLGEWKNPLIQKVFLELAF